MSRLVTTRELAELFQVDRRTVHRWEHYEGFPGHIRQPTDQASHQNFYDLEAVKNWAIATGRWDAVVDLPTRWALSDHFEHCDRCGQFKSLNRSHECTRQQLNKEQAA